MPPSLRLEISQQHLQQIIDEGRDGSPYEMCGLAGGRNGRVEIVTPVPNASLTPLTNFEMERQAMVDAIIAYQHAGLDVVAIYHSHPMGDAVPSEGDIAGASWPDAIYLIVGLRDPEQPDIRAWSIQYGRVEAADITVIA